MANRHVSASGSNTSPYDTWAKAATSWVSAVTGSADGDVFYIDSAFTTATIAAGSTLTFPGGFANASMVYSGTPDTTAGFGITAIVAGAGLIVDGTAVGTVGGNFALYGINIAGQTFGSVGLGSVSTYNMALIGCTLKGPATTHIGPQASGAFSYVWLENCNFHTGNGSPRYYFYGNVRMRGGQFDLGGSRSGATAFWGGARGCDLEMIDFDASWHFSNVELFRADGGNCNIRMRDCILPSSYSVDLMTSSTYGNQMEASNCCPNGTYGPWRLVGLDGKRKLEAVTTNVRSGGATDGTTAFALKLTTLYPGVTTPCLSTNFLALNTNVSGLVTVTVEISHSLSALLTTANAWLEVEYMASNLNSQGYIATNRAAPLTAGVAHPTSAASWSGSETKKQSMSVSFYPNQAGYLIARVGTVAAANSIIYIDPVLTIS